MNVSLAECVIVTYNSAEVIEAASIAVGLCTVVVDNASSDETLRAGRRGPGSPDCERAE